MRYAADQPHPCGLSNWLNPQTPGLQKGSIGFGGCSGAAEFVRATARTATARIAEEAVIVVLSGHGPNPLWRLRPGADVISSEADVTREGDARDFVEQSCSRLSSQFGWGFAPHACTIRGRPLSVVGSAASA